MFGIGAPELVVILVVALVVLGPKRLPELAKGLGRALGEFRRATSGITEELDNARIMLEEEVRQAERTAQYKNTQYKNTLDKDTLAEPTGPGIMPASDAAAKVAPSILSSGSSGKPAESAESAESAPAQKEPEQEKPVQ
jgi:sec-independent protein translocase protein TatB